MEPQGSQMQSALENLQMAVNDDNEVRSSVTGIEVTGDGHGDITDVQDRKNIADITNVHTRFIENSGSVAVQAEKETLLGKEEATTETVLRDTGTTAEKEEQDTPAEKKDTVTLVNNEERDVIPIQGKEGTVSVTNFELPQDSTMREEAREESAKEIDSSCCQDLVSITEDSSKVGEIDSAECSSNEKRMETDECAECCDNATSDAATMEQMTSDTSLQDVEDKPSNDILVSACVPLPADTLISTTNAETPNAITDCTVAPSEVIESQAEASSGESEIISKPDEDELVKDDAGKETEETEVMDEGGSGGTTKECPESKDGEQNTVDDTVFPASRLFEYQWPIEKDADCYMLQEQLCEFLAVVSFKRRYPDLQRRSLELKERIHLLENGIVTEMQCDLGLTALKVDQVHELMSRDYPEKFQEYAVVLQKRQEQKIADEHKGYEMLKLEKIKLETLVRKAVKSAAEFNASFMKERREERRAYIDLQTNEIHYPRRPVKFGPHLPVGAYPVALIPGQFQDHYKSYTPQELKYLPLSTAMYNAPRSMKTVFADPNQPEDVDTEEEGKMAAGRGSDGTSSGTSTSGSSSGSENESDGEKSADNAVAVATPQRPANRPAAKRLRNSVRKGAKKELCNICKSSAERNRTGEAEDLVTCSECVRSAHPSCLELTAELIPIIRTYPWQCMECKTCVRCMEPHDEDKVMFCDHCDRGYHSYCVSLQTIPTGRWECPSCVLETPRAKRTRKR